MIQAVDDWILIGAAALVALLMGLGAWQMIARLPEQMQREWYAEAQSLLAGHGELGAPSSNRDQPSISALPILFTTILCLILSAWAIGVHGWTLAAVLSMAFAWFGVVLAGIDLRVQLLPDRLVLPLGMLGLAANGFGIFCTAEAAIFGAVAGFLVLWGINALHRLLRGYDGMGLGDAKLLAACGAWLGVHQLAMVVLIAASLGIIAGIIHRIRQGASKPFAFGPYLIFAAWLCLLYGERMLHGCLLF